MMNDQTRAQQPADQPRDATGRRAPDPAPLFPLDEREKIAQCLEALRTSRIHSARRPPRGGSGQRSEDD